MAPIIGQKELDKRKLLGIHAATVTNIHSHDFPGHYPHEDHAWSVDKFRQNLRVDIHANDSLDLSFSLIGVDASVANAFRRIMMDEVASVAVEDIYLLNNTSVIQDEVLAHRIGLIPLCANREGLRALKWLKKASGTEPEGARNEDTVLVLNLQVKCEWQEDGKKRAREGETDPLKLYKNAHVYAHQLQFLPSGEQGKTFKPPNQLRAVNPDILIAKLRPDQEIDLKMHCYKGIGSDHAKFSPVATASYRLMPSIDIIQPILGRDARKFARCFPKGVIGLEKMEQDDGEETVKAVVKDPMRDTVSRECLRHDEFQGKVKLGRIRDHFIFRVESTGQWESEEIFVESVRLLRAKCQKMKKQLSDLERSK